MKRLTYYESGLARYNLGRTQYQNEIADRLAAYEDTGLEPEEIAHYASAKETVGDDLDLMRLVDLLKADAEGRLLVLPDDLTAAADELDKRRWVPVEERLPEQSGAYLVILYTVPDVARLYYYYAPNEEFGQTRSGVWCAETVTHWMPLPEPPEEVTP